MEPEFGYDNSWISTSNGGLLITGPCSAESEQQVLETAQQVASFFPEAIFRAGAWKPRTRPNSFEGKGIDALKWISQVKAATGLRTATEVALPKHLEAALKYNIDVVWIGARTSGNPFMVQELAEGLRGTNIPVMVKNPLHPDLQLWIGAIERIRNSGIKQVAAIHRGFYTYEQSEYRNIPRWELVPELKTLKPGLPVICDISHIAGNSSLLKMIAQQAVDLNFDGMMIESHHKPAQALSDASQQVSPAELNDILLSLHKRNAGFNEQITNNKLAEIRQHIDEIDNRLLLILKERMNCAMEIGELKKQHNVSILQLRRWKEIIESCMVKADKTGLYKEFIRNIFIQIHDESIRIQALILLDEEVAEKSKN
jgi:chorismate mutase